MPGLGPHWQRFLPPPASDVLRSDFANAYAGETICIAGAGGYIGSALTLALAAGQPRFLILLDSSEHGLFALQRRMQAAHPGVACEYLLGDIADRALLHAVFARTRPRVVFHAAAFKHVALLEHSPFAAIQNNVLGTSALLRSAREHGVCRFVLISTDKAANPHSVMGVSKRLAELLTLSLNGSSAIRLGNVIGSSGSVIPIFLEQIAQGVPLSVTHPDVHRYFLSRQETVNAILAAGQADCDATILIPELAPPVPIAELARFLLKAHGLAPELYFTGLQPGEKLHEDLTAANELQVGTLESGLKIFSSRKLLPPQADDLVTQLAHCLTRRDRSRLLALLCEFVPEYVPSPLMQEAGS